MAQDAGTVVASYFDVWKKNDFSKMRTFVADDVTCVGPMGKVDNADDYLQGIEGLSKIKTDIVIQKMFVDGPDVLTWYDLHTSEAGSLPVANWNHVEHGTITRTRVTFDPRPIAP